MKMHINIVELLMVQLKMEKIYEGTLRFTLAEELRLNTYETYKKAAEKLYKGYLTESETEYFRKATKAFEEAMNREDCPTEDKAELKRKHDEMKWIRLKTYQYQVQAAQGLRRRYGRCMPQCIFP